MNHSLQIFVYGTLRPPQNGTLPGDSRYHPAIDAHIRSAKPATLSGADLYDLGSYPAAVPGEGTLHGDLLLVDEAALAVADHIEGHPTFYKRTQVTVQTDAGPETAWIYWGPPGIETGRRRVRSGDWFARAEEESEPLMAASDATEVDETLRALVQRFAESDCSWLSTVRPNSRAHSAPMWHVWLGGRVYLVTQPKAVKTTNIAENPSVVISHPDPLNPIIIEGWAIEAPHMWDALQPIFQQKYDWDIVADAEYHTILEITPTRLLAWGNQGEGRWTGAEIMAQEAAALKTSDPEADLPETEIPHE